MKNTIIAIDGPAGAGKTTLAKLLAEKLGLLYIDTGAMYRSLTWKIMKLGVDFNNKDLTAEIARKINIKLKPDGKNLRVFVDGDDVTDEIRTPEVTGNVFHAAQMKEVREEMVKLQRCLARENGVVMEGRDIGTVVFPFASRKIYLDAELRERANRRFKEFKLKAGVYCDTPPQLSEVEKELDERDKKDKAREYGPLKMAVDAVRLDTTNLNISEMVERAVEIIR